MIAGLRRIATSLWLHFVASPQRVPVLGYRRLGRPVVNLIYRLPPPSSNTSTSARSRDRELRESPLSNTRRAKRDRAIDAVSGSTDPSIALLALLNYAGPEGDSRLRRFAGAGDPAPHETRRGWREISFLELMSQTVRDLDFCVGREGRRWIAIRIVVMRLRFNHRRLLHAYRGPASEISCQNNPPRLICVNQSLI